MIHHALRSMRQSLSHTIFFTLTFIITSAFILLYFTLALSDEIGVTLFYSSNNIQTVVSILVILICMVAIFFANDFYVKQKAQDLAVQLVCGATYSQLVLYLLMQTGLLMMIGIVSGMALGLFMMPGFNVILEQIFHVTHMLSFNQEAFVATVVVLVMVIFYATFLNLGYSYRNSIHNLLVNRGEMGKIGFRIPKLFRAIVTPKVKGMFALILVVMMTVMFCLSDASDLFGYALIWLFGFSLAVNNVVLPGLRYLVAHKWAMHPHLMAIGGFLRHDIHALKSELLLLIGSDIIFYTLMIRNVTDAVASTLSGLSFVVVNILMSMVIMFKYSSEVSTRSQSAQVLLCVGYLMEDIDHIIRRETLLFYAFIVLSDMIVITTIGGNLVIHHIISQNLLMGMIVLFLIPMAICMLMNMFYYHRVIHGDLLQRAE
ncbi:MAG: hypothetical protein J6P61_03210 [Erysipelotrichaceae bacterium]|nr:hypothetical protein [Erysipelotrichaceae bacterium]